jgi:phage-related baseplate assembly protein
MSRYSAEQLDLSRLPPFSLVEADYESERSDLVAGMSARLAERGIAFDVGNLEANPFVALAEEVAYRKTLDLQALNDAGKRLTLIHAYGPALDHIAATYYADLGLRRLVVTAADAVTGSPAVVELDDRFRRRILLAPEARTPGTLGGYEFWALTAAPRLVDAKALNHSSGLVTPGQVLVVLLGGETEAEDIEIAGAFLRDRTVKLASDTVIVRAATRVAVDLSAVLEMLSGASPSLVTAEARRRLAAYVSERRQIGKRVTESSLKAALTVGGVEAVRLPGFVTDVDPGSAGIVEISTPSITTEVVGG